MPFDPDKYIAFDPDKFIAEPSTPDVPAPPPESWSDMAKRVGKNIVTKSPYAVPFQAAHAAWTDPAGTLQTADDAMRAAANAVTFGQADRLAGYMNSGGPQTLSGLVTGQKPLTYDEAVNAEVRKSEAARIRSPAASVVGDVAGSAAIPGFGAEALAARMGSGLLARGAAYGGTGALTGAAQGAGHTYTGNPSDYLWNAGIGGTVGLVTGGLGGAAFGARPSKPPAAATIAEQRATTNAAYAALNANPVRYGAPHLAQRADDIAQTFATNPRQRAIPRHSPTSFDVLDEMRAPAAVQRPSFAGPATVGTGDIELLRSTLNTIPQTKEHGRDLVAARFVKHGLDDFVENPPVGAILPGQANAEAARRAAAQGRLARQSYAGQERSQISENLARRAQSRSKSIYSGLNTEAELRKEYQRFTAPDIKSGRSKAQNAGFNANEIAAIEQFHQGVDTPLRNKIRYLANVGGGGGGLGALAAGGVGLGAGAAYASDDPRWLAALGAPAAGFGLRLAGNKIATGNIRALNEMIRMRNPTSQYLQMTQPRISGGGDPASAKLARDLFALELAKRQAQTE